MGETKMVTFDQTTVRRLKEIVSSHARNLGCGGTCLDDACQYDGPCDIADIMETLWAASGGIDVVSMPAQTYGTLRAQLAEANAACAAMREALELLREIQSAGVSFEDARVAYVEIQVPKKTLRAIDAFLKRGEPHA